jgi:hypothetical protein
MMLNNPFSLLQTFSPLAPWKVQPSRVVNLTSSFSPSMIHRFFNVPFIVPMDLVNKQCIDGWWRPYVGALNIGFNL